MTGLGVALFAAAVLWLGGRWRRVRRGRLPARAWAGLLILAAGSALLAMGVWPVTVYFTPIAWTGYILIMDGAVESVRGRSWLSTDWRSFAWAAFLSIPLWLIFEGYNLRLRNWVYVGLPESAALRYLGYGWAFATIWPAMSETADLLLATGWGEERQRAVRLPEKGLMVAGAAALILPAVVPARWGAYLFGLVWVGFMMLVDPLNHRAGRTSVAGDLAEGRRGRLWALMVAGLVCGILWEFWNYWAGAKWVYVFPILQGAKIFEMPAPGYLGFPPFAVEVFAMYVWATGRLGIRSYACYGAGW